LTSEGRLDGHATQEAMFATDLETSGADHHRVGPNHYEVPEGLDHPLDRQTGPVQKVQNRLEIVGAGGLGLPFHRAIVAACYSEHPHGGAHA
jgi:hypothetical protein